MRLFDFRCEDCSEVVEELVKTDTQQIMCKNCEGVAHRLVSPVRAKLDLSFPGAISSWERKRDSHMKWENKRIAANGSVE